MFETEAHAHFCFFASGAGHWQLFDWKSDASFLYCRKSSSARRISEVVLIGGSYVQWGEERHTAPGSAADYWTWQR